MQMSAQQISEQLQIKRMVRKELRQLRPLLKEQSGEKFKNAFLDIFRALRLAAMDIGNSLRLALGSIFTFDPEKIEKKIRDFDDRRQKINAEWAPIVERTKESIGSADPILTMAIIGPANFFAMQGLGAGLVAGKTVAEVIAAKNWDSIINSFTVPLNVNQSLQAFFQEYSRNEEERREREDERDEAGTGTGGKRSRRLSRLARLFSEEATLGSDLINEQTEKSITLSEEEAIAMFVKATGLDKKFQELINEHKQNLKDTLPAILSDIVPMMSVADMFAAKNMKDFKNAVQVAKTKNPKIKDGPFANFEKKVNEETQKTLKNAKAMSEFEKMLNGKKLSQQQLESEVKKNVFSSLKSGFDKQVADSLRDARDTAKSAIKNLKIDEQTMKYMQNSDDPELVKLLDIYKRLISAYDSINVDYENKAKSGMK